MTTHEEDDAPLSGIGENEQPDVIIPRDESEPPRDDYDNSIIGDDEYEEIEPFYDGDSDDEEIREQGGIEPDWKPMVTGRS